MTSTTTAPGALNGNGALRAPSPPAGGPTPRTKQMASRQRTRMILGLLLVLGSALAAAVLYANVGNRHAVLVVDRSVPVGQEITAADLGEALVSGDGAVRATIPSADAGRIVGRFAAVDLVAGSFLASGHLADGPLAGSDDAVIGATLREGQYPLGVTDGDRVLAVVLPPESAPAEETPDAVPVEATVVAVGELSDLGGIAVSLAVQPDDAPRVAIAGARGRLALVVVPR